MFVLTKIEAARDEKIAKILITLSRKSLVALPKSKMLVYKKFRYVDPLFMRKNRLIKLSDVNKKFRQTLEIARSENDLGITTPLI